MRRIVFYSLSLGVVAGGLSIYFLMGRVVASSPVLTRTPELTSNAWVAAPGRVEPISEEIRVGSEISGKIKSVLVDEGDRVKRGQVIAILENSDYQAQVASAEADLDLKEAELRRVTNGAREQERREAWATVQEAEAALNIARSQLERRQRLFQEGIAAREELDRAQWESQAAQRHYEAATQHYALINDQAREEDVTKARSDVAAAHARLDEARARFAKTLIRSPLGGVVLRRHLKSGENVEDVSANPIVTVADNAVLRVRVDVDETDIAKVRPGEEAYVKADAFPGRKFTGRVVRISHVLGKKNILTGEARERIDTKVLETLIQLDDGHELPIGLRVDAFIRAAEAAPAGKSDSSSAKRD